MFEISIRHWFNNDHNKIDTLYLFANLSGTFLALIRITEPMVF